MGISYFSVISDEISILKHDPHRQLKDKARNENFV